MLAHTMHNPYRPISCAATLYHVVEIPKTSVKLFPSYGTTASTMRKKKKRSKQVATAMALSQTQLGKVITQPIILR